MIKENSAYYFCRFCDSILKEETSSYKVLDKSSGKTFFSCSACKKDGENLSKGKMSEKEFRKLLNERRKEALLEKDKIIAEAKLQGKKIEIIKDREKWKQDKKEFINKNYEKWSFQYLAENSFKPVQEVVDNPLNCRICQTDIKKTDHYLARKQGIEEMNKKFGTSKFELISNYCHPCLEKVIYSTLAKMVEEKLVFIETYEEFKEIADEEKNKAEKMSRNTNS